MGTPDYNKLGRGIRRIINKLFEYDDRIPRECFSSEDVDVLQETETLMFILDYQQHELSKEGINDVRN